MSTWENYLNFDNNNGEYKEKQLKIIDKIQLSDDTIKKIKSINKKIEIFVAAQISCPDCRATVPFLKKFSDLNSNIEITYANREDATLVLKEFSDVEKTFNQETKKAKLPTVTYKNGDKFHLIFAEFPSCVKQKMQENPDDYENIKYNFRVGKFNDQIEDELTNVFLSL